MGEAVGMGAGNIWKISVSFFRVCCKPKTALTKSLYFFKVHHCICGFTTVTIKVRVGEKN